jgi:hypothetical protein
VSELHQRLIWFAVGVLLPLWLAAGVLDYVCHRRSAIEQTSGFRESALHLLQAAELAVALAVGLTLEINALTLGVMIALVLAHSLTAYWDVSYTTSRRHISPLEQHIHGYLEWIPIIVVSLVVIVNWSEFQAPAFEIRLKERPLSPLYIWSGVALIVLVPGALLAEELLRTWRVARAPGAIIT